MIINTWAAWSQDWLAYDKVDFDGINKLILVHPEVTQLDIRADVYSAWVDWTSRRDNSKFLPAIRYTGYDPMGAGMYTGDVYFLRNGWRLCLNIDKVRVTGVLFSDDYDTAYYTYNLVEQHPARVAALVTTYEKEVPATVTPESIRQEIDANSIKLANLANEVWDHEFVAKLLTVAKFLGLK